MRINHLHLTNFRNYTSLDLDFAPEGALICGKNGSGKTNLLEAIAYSAFGKSFLALQDRDLTSFEETFFRIAAEFTFLDKQITIESSCDKDQKKVSINNRRITRLSELFKYIKVVYLSPRDIEFSSGNPGFRRYFFDLAISQNSFYYMEKLKEYNRILKQRNALLKRSYEPKEKLSWDRNFVKIGCEIINLRSKYMKQFIPRLIEFNNFISDNKEELSYRYSYSFPVKDNDIHNSFMEFITANGDREKQYQRSLCGPHLDDFHFMLNDNSFRKFGSQGQKRSLAISARLVQASLIAESVGDYPILMFDDVLADLDTERTERILELLRDDHQIFIATPNKSHYDISDFNEIDLEKL